MKIYTFKKIIFFSLIISMAATNVYAFSLSEYVKDRENITDDLLNSIETESSSNDPLVSAKKSVKSNEEAILNPVNLTGNIVREALHTEALVRSTGMDTLQIMIEEGLLEFNEETGEYEASEDFDVSNISGIFDNPKTFGVLSLTLTKYAGLSSNAARNTVLGVAAWAALGGAIPILVTLGPVVGVVVLSILAIEAIRIVGDISGIEEINEVLDGTLEALGIAGLIGGLLGGLFGDDTPGPSDILDAIGLKDAATVVKSAEETASPLTKYWGGVVLLPPLPCSCEAGTTFLVTVLDFKTKLPLLLKIDTANILGNKLFLYYNFYTPGVSMLGSYSGVTTCITGVAPICIPIPVHGQFDNQPGTGSSKTPRTGFGEIRSLFGQ
jgi:hypothetical protein